MDQVKKLCYFLVCIGLLKVTKDTPIGTEIHIRFDGGPEELQRLLAPTGALVLMMVYYISKAAPTFSDLEQLCLSILLEVSL